MLSRNKDTRLLGTLRGERRGTKWVNVVLMGSYHFVMCFGRFYIPSSIFGIPIVLSILSNMFRMVPCLASMYIDATRYWKSFAGQRKMKRTVPEESHNGNPSHLRNGHPQNQDCKWRKSCNSSVISRYFHPLQGFYKSQVGGAGLWPL